jgi:hypothetical protein
MAFTEPVVAVLSRPQPDNNRYDELADLQANSGDTPQGRGDISFPMEEQPDPPQLGDDVNDSGFTEVITTDDPHQTIEPREENVVIGHATDYEEPAGEPADSPQHTMI